MHVGKNTDIRCSFCKVGCKFESVIWFVGPRVKVWFVAIAITFKTWASYFTLLVHSFHHWVKIGTWHIIRACYVNGKDRHCNMTALFVCFPGR